MISSSNRKFQLLLHKIGYLNLEIEEKKDRLDSHAKDFNQNYRGENRTDQNSADDASSCAPPGGVSQECESTSSPSEIEEKSDDPDDFGPNSNDEYECGGSEEIRKIWKAIALKTHPDKTGNDQTLTSLYKKAAAAYDEKRYEVLIEIAAQLSISIDSPSDDLIEMLEIRVTKLEADLKRIEDSVLWAWSSAPPEKKRAIEEALRSYRKHKKKKRSKP